MDFVEAKELERRLDAMQALIQCSELKTAYMRALKTHRNTLATILLKGSRIDYIASVKANLIHPIREHKQHLEWLVDELEAGEVTTLSIEQ